MRRSFLGHLVRWVALMGCFVLAALTGIVLHADRPAARRLLARGVTGFVTQELHGAVRLGGVSALHTGGVLLSSLSARDELGREVLTIHRARIRIDWLRTLLDTLFATGKLTVVVEHVRVDGVTAALFPTGQTDVPSLVRALTPRPRGTKAPSASTRPYRIWFSAIELGDARVALRLVSLPSSEVELLRVRGSVLANPQGAAVDIEEATLRWKGLARSDVLGTATLHVRTPDRFWGTYTGRFGTLPVELRASLAHGKLTAHLETPEARPDSVRELWGAWPLQRAAQISINAEGTLPNLFAQLTAGAGSGKVQATGPIRFGSQTQMRLDVEWEELDLSTLVPNGPTSRLSGSGRIEAWLQRQNPRVAIDAQLAAGTILGVETPPAEGHATYDSTGLVLKGTISEPGLPLQTALLWQPDGALEIDLRAHAVTLEAVERLPPLGLRGTVSPRLRAKLAQGNLSATLESSILGLSGRGASLERGSLQATLVAPISDLAQAGLRVDLNGQQLTTPWGHFAELTMQAQGPVAEPRLTLRLKDPVAPALTLSSVVRTTPTQALLEPEATLGYPNRQLLLSAREIGIGDNGLSVQNLEVTGAGGPIRSSFVLSGQHLQGDLNARELDVGRLAEALGLPQGEASGQLDANLVVDDAQGSTLQLEARDITYGPVAGVSGMVDAALQDNRFVSRALVRVEGFGEVGVLTELDTAGPLLATDSWSQATGRASLELSGFDLGPIGATLSLFSPVRSLTGKVNARLQMERREAAELPDLNLSLDTQGLALDVGQPTPMLSLRGVDLTGSAAVDGATGDLNAALTAHQSGTPLAQAHLGTRLPLADLLSEPRRALSTLYDTPGDLALHVPEQPLSRLTTLFGMPALPGVVAAELAVQGSLVHPVLVAHARGGDLVLVDGSPNLDASATVRYDHSTGETGLVAWVGQDNTHLAELEGAGFVVATPGFDWQGRLEANLLGLPVATIPGLATHQVSGNLRGSASLSRNGRVSASQGLLSLDAARIGNLPLGETLFGWQSEPDDLQVDIQLIDGGAEVDAEGHVAVDWRAPLALLRDDKPARISARINNYDAGVLLPLVGNWVRSLGGNLNGQLEATLTPHRDSEGSLSYTTAVGGQATYGDGHILLGQYGINLQDIDATFQASSNGTTTLIHVPNLALGVQSPEQNLKGTADLELSNLELRRVAARLSRVERLPLALDGVTYAELTGKAQIDMTLAPTQNEMDITIEELTAQLALSSQREIVDLADHPDITVNQPLKERLTTDQNATAVPWLIRIALGQAAKVTRSNLSIPIAGFPELRIDEQVHPSGTIVLRPGGRLQLLGKTFVIDSGTVRLDPDQPANPFFDLTATWTGPSHQVTVQIQGTRQQARLRLSSNPPVASDSQIQSLLLGGSSGDSSSSAGLGVGASLLNEMFVDTPLAQVELRTSHDTRHTNYTAAVPLEEDLWFEATYKNPQSNSVRPGAATEEPGFSGTVDWRFRKDWSVRSEIGTLGAGLDLLWQYRY